MRPSRRDPDTLLEELQKEERQARRGQLKVFLGYAAGVGKTYAMLESARRLEAEGVDVVVGLVETHGRAETEVLLERLEVLPRKPIDHRGIRLAEFDLDAALARRPQVLLVDDLAHSNLPGCRHPKRYQDVLELLEAGIDVHTTFNIQHLESLKDVLKQITGVVVRETLPDRLLEEASQISLVDLPPEELLERLEQGKVYVPELAARAASRFFRHGNLLALRELSLRETAQRVDVDVRNYMRQRAIEGPWPAGERLLVCVGPSPLSERLVRAARRLSDALDAPWIAFHAEVGRLSPPERERVAGHLELAESLGAEVRTRSGPSLVDTVVDFAHRENVTKIVAGKPLGLRWQDLVRGSLVDRILRRTRGIDIFVIGGDSPEEGPPKPRPPAPRHTPDPYLAAATVVAAATALGQPLLPWLKPTNQVMVYLAGVVFVAYYFGRGPSFLASFLSVVAFNFFFVPPRFTLAVADPEYLLTFLALLLVGLLVSGLTARARETARTAQEHEQQALTLLSLSRDLGRDPSRQRIAELAGEHLEPLFGPVVVVLAGRDGDALDFGPDLEPGEVAVANWALSHGQPAGRRTSTLVGAAYQWHPLTTESGVLGVVGLEREVHPGQTAEAQLLEALLGQLARSLERQELARGAREAELLKATKELQTALLNAVSHDLRIPLVSITGALSSLLEEQLCLDEGSRRAMIDNALSEAHRLNRLVANLLRMTRLESGAMEIKLVPCDPWDVVSTTLDEMKERLQDTPAGLDIRDELPLVPMDFVLIQHVLINLLENGLRYGQGGIVVTARRVPEGVEFGVLDRGPGVDPAFLDKIFDRFYRISDIGDGGTGLGLSICKGLVEAHGGRIWAEDRPGGGAAFRFVLPLQKESP